MTELDLLRKLRIDLQRTNGMRAIYSVIGQNTTTIDKKIEELKKDIDGMKYWVTGDYDTIPIEDLETDHLGNILRCYLNYDGFEKNRPDELIDLRLEMKLRMMENPEIDYPPEILLLLGTLPSKFEATL